MAHRQLTEIDQDLARVRAAINALPESAIRQGLDEDYQAQIDALEDERQQAIEADE